MGTPADVFTDAAGVRRFQGSIVGTAGAVLSVFGRAGNVVATTGDYTAAQVGAIATTAGAVGTTNLAAVSVTTAKIANSAVTATQIATNAVVTAAINTGAVTLAKMAATFPYLLIAAAPPTVFTSPIVFDTTAVTGGLYAWDGTAYQQVGDPL